MRDLCRLLAVLAASLPAVPAHADELFAGAYVHEVDTPFTLKVAEQGADIAIGYRFAPIEGLRAVGKPAPYVIASVNTAGDTSFAGAGLSWTIGKGRFYVRPAVALVVHDGDTRRIEPLTGVDRGLGSSVLFEPELGLGWRASDRLAVEASWMHVSHAQLFGRQNPGIDMMGLRLNLGL
ncbi:MAG: acyloxyacyl hydrolase [Novosphingobium sp.]|nr:acyloxyacyl hydrolase [Novosphingobium sp.]